MKVTRSLIRKILQEKFYSDDFRDVYATARMAHFGQKRRSGEDYFSHPAEVSKIVNKFYPEDKISKLAALLHDTLEDAPGSTVDSIEEMEGFIKGSITDPRVGEEVTRVVRSLTHEKGGDYLSYVVSLLSDVPSLRVKLADMVHNLSSSPSEKQKNKYKNALDAISRETNGHPPNGISLSHWNTLQDLTGPEIEMKITERQLRRIIRKECTRVIKEDRASWLNIIFDVMGDTPQFQIQQSGYHYDLTEYSRGDFESFIQEFETDHSADMPAGQVVHDSYGLGFPNDVLPLRDAWDFVFDAIESM